MRVVAPQSSRRGMAKIEPRTAPAALTSMSRLTRNAKAVTQPMLMAQSCGEHRGSSSGALSLRGPSACLLAPRHRPFCHLLPSSTHLQRHRHRLGCPWSVAQSGNQRRQAEERGEAGACQPSSKQEESHGAEWRLCLCPQAGALPAGRPATGGGGERSGWTVWCQDVWQAKPSRQTHRQQTAVAAAAAAASSSGGGCH